MITPRRTTLTTVHGPRALQPAVAALAAAPDAWLARATAILVPTRAAAAELRHTLENLWLVERSSAAPRAVVLPDILTRGEWYRRLAVRLVPGLRVLSEIEREVLLGAAAREVAAGGTAPPFRMRPALAAEMVRFYDTLRRQQKSVADFERLVLEDLEPRSEFDRGAERLLRQTRFLVATFRLYERRVEAAAAVDEHGLRERLLDAPAGYSRLIVTVGDRVSDPSAGLYPADFDLLTRQPHVESIDVVATRAALLAGLGERLRGIMPGIEDRQCGDGDHSPALIVPAEEAGRLHFVARDREEELRDLARRIKKALREPGAEGAPRVAVVFRRPLPYVYLGRTVFAAGGVQAQVSDALPLAAEPFSAALDLVFAVVGARFARQPLVQLLRSPHLGFGVEGAEVSAAEIGALDRALAEGGYLGDLERLRALAETIGGPAARAAVGAAAELAPLCGKDRTSSHLARLVAFVRAHERLDAPDDETRARHLRARAAVLTILEDMRAAALLHDDPVVSITEIAAAARRWIESQTFAPARGDGGVRLVDAESARYGDFDEVHLAGLVAGDWPAASPRNVFYPQFLLTRLGWPAESDRLAAERAAFADLLRLARRRVSVSSFMLEDDAIVEPSPLLEEIERAGLPVEPQQPAGHLPTIFVDEALVTGEASAGSLPSGVAEWARLRASRTPASAPVFHGATQAPGTRVAASAARPYTVTGLDRYLECPFKYFAATVLKLPEEPTDELGLSPKERGRFVHEVFRSFFHEWQSRGGAEITVERLDEARALFADVSGRLLDSLPPSEAALERLRLIGSVAAPGLGEVVLAAEVERGAQVSKRLLEFAFEGDFELSSGETTRRVRLRGKADRVDILADGRLRIIDYKIGRPPDDSLQLPIYAVCLFQQFGRERRAPAGVEGLYVAFGDLRSPIRVAVAADEGAAAVLEKAQRRALEAIDGIERGHFPPRPASPRLCSTCAHSAVCRKDYAVAD